NIFRNLLADLGKNSKSGQVPASKEGRFLVKLGHGCLGLLDLVHDIFYLRKAGLKGRPQLSLQVLITGLFRSVTKITVHDRQQQHNRRSNCKKKPASPDRDVLLGICKLSGPKIEIRALAAKQPLYRRAQTLDVNFS